MHVAPLLLVAMRDELAEARRRGFAARVASLDILLGEVFDRLREVERGNDNIRAMLRRSRFTVLGSGLPHPPERSDGDSL